jgi:tetratricopeptide (TPR) repeat protein
MGAGYGLSSWLFGPMLYNWGYSNYSNPYYGGGGYGGAAAVQQPIAYDYGQPIDATAAPPEESVANQAVSTLDQGREAFKQGDYTRALDLADQSLRQMPNDPALHEFRALALFALGRYDEAAAALYAVLSVGPGWDWSTLIGLYGNPDAYTQQLRALESSVTQNPNSAAGRFVLAYHYLTQGHMNEAADQLKAVVALQPKDQLSAQLLQQIQQKDASPAPGNPANAPAENPPGPAPANGAAPPAEDPPGPAPASGAKPPTENPPGPAPAPASNPEPTGKEGNLQGTWTAQPSKDTTITVTFQDKGHFTWKVAHQGQDHQFQGDSSYVNGILTLAQDQNNAMVGDLNWQDPNHFQFKVLGGGPSDPGLTFAKSS